MGPGANEIGAGSLGVRRRRRRRAAACRRTFGVFVGAADGWVWDVKNAPMGFLLSLFLGCWSDVGLFVLRDRTFDDGFTAALRLMIPSGDPMADLCCYVRCPTPG
jgi:hypothetical protein